MVLARINDNWRRYKTTIKQTHILPYKCVNEMLKNRPKSIPESHFRKLIAYWRTEKVKKMSVQNKKNRAQQKFRHRKGPINFARIRARLKCLLRLAKAQRENHWMKTLWMLLHICKLRIKSLKNQQLELSNPYLGKRRQGECDVTEE
ncbi:uncharacterized protein LOC127744229 [Arachis duranensis]|uniref:Uncharacterized protein LOC127744229 n=1 Tax=Arachis duranensis TaxID=130453 RepID=A0A9C6WJU6_ARADU|nr:uncharacterized protein LOC127744229 [Arachis duranensis]